MKKVRPFIIPALIIIAIISIFYFLYTSSEKKRIENEISQLDNQLGNSRLSANQTIDMYAKKKALLQQLLKLY